MDQDRFLHGDEDADSIEEVLTSVVRNGEMRTVHDPGGWELIYFNRGVLSGMFPLELN